MLQLDEVLDAEPNVNDIKQMAELRIRNLLAFDELQSYNDSDLFLYKHPLIKNETELMELQKLLRSNPDEFLRKHRCALDNVRRYEAYVRKPDRKKKRVSDRALLEKHRNRAALFKTILETKNQEES
jgi:hypothetical protein